MVLAAILVCLNLALSGGVISTMIWLLRNWDEGRDCVYYMLGNTCLRIVLCLPMIILILVWLCLKDSATSRKLAVIAMGFSIIAFSVCGLVDIAL